MEERPGRELIVDAFKEYLKPYFKASRNDWKRESSSQEEKDGFVELFQSLEKYMMEQSDV